MKKYILIALLIVVMTGFVTCYVIELSKSGDNALPHVKESAYSYLVNSYNSTLGLCYENPENKSIYWVANDNVLVSYALRQWNRTIADNITETIKRIARDYNLTTSLVGIPLNCRAEILLGYNVDFFFNETKLEILDPNYYGSNLTTEKATNNIITDFENYTDLLCYASLVEWRNKEYSQAYYYYGKAKEMWDGNGFKDKAFNGSYAAYKLGLFYFVNKMIRIGSFVFEKQLIERVWLCQDSNGGFKTDYYGNGSFPFCQTNTETTSIILLSGVPQSLEYEEGVKVGAYYYIWWGPLPPNETRNHWNESIKGTPFLGKYNSNDPTVADQHILLAKKHGIDFFAVSWFGKGEWLNWDYDDVDQNLRSGLLNSSHLSSFQFCLFYESESVLNDALNATLNPDQNFTKIFIEDMTYAAQEYFPNPSYLRIDGKPVLFIYNLPYVYNKLGITEAQNLFNILRQRSDVYLVGDVGTSHISPHDVNSLLLYSMNATTNYFFAHTNASEGWQKILEYAITYYPEWRTVMNPNRIKFIPNAYPGFNNTGLAGVVNSTELPNNAIMFGEMLKIAINNVDGDLKMVMITSWNEWLESTAIEPSMEFGELFLHTIYDIVPEFSSDIILPLFMLLSMLALAYSKKKTH
ncbi:MAG: glycoside hydrolase family 99-like domain-containing protein [Candidatus Bathyarchaeota archaeon]|nr:glycoside hydrolase family 99-like domain-containing protein [Candidatus Bathyarchaeota archaeon]